MSGKLFRIASGANGSDYHWTEVLMRDIPHHMLDGVALHHYSVIDWNKKGSATAFSEYEYAATLKQALQMEELVTKHSAIMDKYDPGKKVALVVDEWGAWYDVEQGTNPGFLYQQNTLRDALLAGVTLNIFNNHSDRVRMANLAQTVNVLQAVILTNKSHIVLTPTYHIMEMYTVHHDATLLPVQVETDLYVLGDNKLPIVSASASKDANGFIHISLINIHPQKSETVALLLPGKDYQSVTGKIVTAQKIQDFNSFEKPDLIKPVVFKNASVKNNQLTITLPPHAVVVLEVK
jgi:alpha-N-arabinofuranosidase